MVGDTFSLGPIAAPNPRDPLQREALADPLGFLQSCAARSREFIVDYRCRFHRLEKRGERLDPGEVMDVRFRESPYSVSMRWIQNPREADSICYVAGRWNQGGRSLALVEPHGVLGWLTPGGVKIDIHGARARSVSERSIDQFGFQKTIDRILELCESMESDPEFRLRFLGTGRLDGRESLVFERRLPYHHPVSPSHDRILLLYIDREWRVTTGCFAFADDDRRDLLGSYVTTDVEFNAGLTEEDF